MTITAGQCTARVESERAAWLQAKLAHGEPSAWAGFSIVKRSTVRTILAGEDVHVKLFRAVRLSDRARDALAGSRASKELENLRVARARGIACVRPLAAGTIRGTLGARSFLITETAPGTPLPRGPLAPDVAARAGAFLRLAHDRGLRALDLHPGNLLLGTDLLLLDLTSASLGGPLEDEERAHALAFFCQDLDGGARDAAAAPLLAGYGASEWLVARAFWHGERLRRHALGAFGRRALRACRDTLVAPRRRGPRVFLHTGASELHDAARALVARLHTVAPVKQGRRGAIRIEHDLACKTRTAAAAQRLFVAAYWLRFAKIPHAAPVLLHLERGIGHVVSRRAHGSTLAELRPSARVALACAASLGDSFGRMHALGLRNRDAKLDNLIYDARTGQVAFVDLDGIKRKAPKDTRGQAHDLGRLLAAFRAAGSPGGTRVLAAFKHSYSRALACLSSRRPSPHLWQLTASRADAWATAHRAR